MPLIRAWLSVLVVLAIGSAARLAAAAEPRGEPSHDDAPARGEPPRVAVVSNEPALDPVVAILQARLGASGSVRMIERTEVRRVLAEQAVSKSALADPNAAVSAGELLAADLIASVEGDASGVAVVVFEVPSGLRLVDAAATAADGEGKADQLAELVIAAVAKRGTGTRAANAGAAGAAGERAVRPLCLTTTRNVDLAKSFDATLDAASIILQQRLLSSPGVSVLDRSRLTRLTDERRLAGLGGAVRVSPILVELQVAHAGQGVTVTAFLTDPAGRKIATVSGAAAAPRPDAIADAILPAILKSLDADLPPAATDEQAAQARSAEARRFVQECVFRWQHEEAAAALTAAEAAFALDPADHRVAAARARALVVCGVVLACEGKFVNPARRVTLYAYPNSGMTTPHPDPAKLPGSLEFALRGVEALRATGVRPAKQEVDWRVPGSPGLLFLDEEPLVRNACLLVREYLGNLRWQAFDRQPEGTGIDPLTSDEEPRRLYDAVRREFKTYRVDQELAQLRRTVNDPITFNAYTRFLDDVLRDLRLVLPNDGTEWTQDWEKVCNDWIDLARRFAYWAPPDPSRTTSAMMPAARPSWPLLQPGMRWVSQWVWYRPVPAAGTEPATLPSLRPATTRPSPAWYMRTVNPYALSVAWFANTRPPYYRKPPTTAEVKVRAELSRKASHVPPAMKDLSFQHGGPQTDSTQMSHLSWEWRMTQADWDRLFGIYDRLKSLPSEEAKVTTSTVWVAYQRLTFAERREVSVKPEPSRDPLPLVKERMLAAAPRAQAEPKPAVGPGTSWPDSLQFVDLLLRPEDGLDVVAFPRVDARTSSVYALGVDVADRGARLKLLRFDMKAGTRTVVSSIDDAEGGRWSRFRNRNRSVDQADYVFGNAWVSMAAGHYVFCDRSRGIFVFPLGGGKPTAIDAKSVPLPAAGFQCATVLDATVYLGLGTLGNEGFLLAYDLRDGSLRTLASSKRIAAGGADGQDTSPFDNTSPLCLWSVVTDEKNGRVVFYASGIGWTADQFGWWAFDPKTRRYAHLASFNLGRELHTWGNEFWAAPLDAEKFAFGGPSTRPSVLDFARDALDPIVSPPTAGYGGPRGEGGQGVAIAPPYAPAGQWVWGRFGRYRSVPGRPDSRTGRSVPHAADLQCFEPLRAGPMMWGSWPSFLEPIDGDAAVVGDPWGLWLVRVPANGPVALVPPRPVGKPIHHAGPPPSGGDLPWADARTVYDFQAEAIGVTGADCPIVRGDAAYVVEVGRRDPERGNLCLARYSLVDGARTEIGYSRATVTRGAVAAMDDRAYFFAPSSRQIIRFPLDGEKPVELDFANPGGEIAGMAALDGKLFIALNPRANNSKAPGAGTAAEVARGRVIRYDVVSGAGEELSLDPVPAANVDLRIAGLAIDGRRTRVVFFSAGGQPADDGDALWTCKADGRPERIGRLPSLRDPEADQGTDLIRWSSAPRDGRMLVATSRKIADVDLVAAKVRTVLDIVDDRDPAARAGGNASAVSDSRFAIRSPFALVDGWLWHPEFSRLHPDTLVREIFPDLRERIDGVNSNAFAPRLLQLTDDGRRVVIADRLGMWALDLVEPTD